MAERWAGRKLSSSWQGFISLTPSLSLGIAGGSGSNYAVSPPPPLFPSVCCGSALPVRPHLFSLCSHNSLDPSPSYNPLFSQCSLSPRSHILYRIALCSKPHSSSVLWLHPITGPKMAFFCQHSRPALKQIVHYNSRRSRWSPHFEVWFIQCHSAT